MRCLAIAVSAVLFAGCTEFSLVFQPNPQFVRVDTWTGVRPGQVNVEAKVGEVLHLPIHALIGNPDLTDTAYDVTTLAVTVNGTAVKPDYHTSSTSISLVFHADQTGSYRVEVRRPPSQQILRHWSIVVAEGTTADVAAPP
jgi:hypothetical protein